MKYITHLVWLLMSINGFSQTMHIAPYFKLKENQIDNFSSVYFPELDSDNKLSSGFSFSPPPRENMGKPFPMGSKELMTKATNVEGFKAYYVIDLEDTLKQDAVILGNHFLSAALIFKNDTAFVAFRLRRSEVSNLHLRDIKNYIPPIVNANDTIVFTSGKMRMILYDFKNETLDINGKAYKNCLNIKIITRWSEDTNSSSVWLSKEHGILKWIRATGRVETRIL